VRRSTERRVAQALGDSVAVAESALIERYFRDLGAGRDDVALGIGDDAALLRVAANAELVLTTDALVEAVHFAAGAPAHSLGHRALAVNLSDIAAMGAAPSWALLSLNLPAIDDDWLAEFAAGFGALARRHAVALVGGNLSRGALSITVELAGQVPRATALRRDGAHAGDDLYVSGSLGDAACGRAVLCGAVSAAPEDAAYLQHRFEYPTPRVELGQALRGLASACIDLSDGLYVDAARLLQASGCGALLAIEQLPLSAALQRTLGDAAWQQAVRGGEDYELCFTAPPAAAAAIAAVASRCGQTISRIGELQVGGGLTLHRGNTVMQFSPSGFDHFRS
jgi:thiamine-monophosphate kinase